MYKTANAMGATAGPLHTTTDNQELEGEIPQLLRDQLQLIEEIHCGLDRLQDKLDPVLKRAAPQGEDKPSVEAVASQIGGQIDNHNQLLNGVIRHVRAIRDRLAL